MKQSERAFMPVRAGEDRHNENREDYNGKRFGTDFTKGFSNSKASFMVHNFPESWGMSELWMLFKKYGMVYDMFMVRKRLRNGQRYGFVRFKDIVDVRKLLQALNGIKIDNEMLKAYPAYERRRDDVHVAGRRKEDTHEFGRQNTKKSKGNWKGGQDGNGGTHGFRDYRNYKEVVEGKGGAWECDASNRKSRDDMGNKT